MTARLAGRSLAWRQLAAVAKREAASLLLGRRVLPLLLLSSVPVLLTVGIVAVSSLRPQEPSLGWTADTFVSIHHALLLTVYFACVWAFTRSFRGEVLDRSLHYLLLAPVRRELLVAGKYLGALASAGSLLAASTAAAFLLLYVPFGATMARQHLVAGSGLAHLGAYLALTILAVATYGAVFLTVGLLLKSPILPAAALLVWELIGFLLPPMLKRLSVVHYLNALRPVPVPEGPFALVAEPPAEWVAVAALMVVVLVFLAVGAWALRRAEVDYGSD